MKNFFRACFSFSRKELNGMLVLCCLLLLLLAARWALEEWLPPPRLDFTEFKEEIALLQAADSTPAGDSADAKGRSAGAAMRSGGVAMRSGGVAMRSGDTAARWGDAATNPARDAVRSFPCKEVELNQADSSDLVPLYGIGPVLSARILRYRERLGGFHSVDQLLEVYGMDTTYFSGFRDCLRADTSLVTKIPLNTAGFNALRRLPYWNSQQIRVLLNYREEHGPFPSVVAIREIQVLETATIQKVIPYLSVNP